MKSPGFSFLFLLKYSSSKCDDELKWLLDAHIIWRYYMISLLSSSLECIIYVYNYTLYRLGERYICIHIYVLQLCFY